MIKGYALVTADPTNGESLSLNVMDEIAHGWTPLGGPFYIPNAKYPTNQGMLAQAMILQEE